MIQQHNKINDSKNTTFNKSSFYGTRYSSSSLLPDSDILEKIVDLFDKERLWRNPGFVICSAHKGPLRKELQGKRVTEQRHMTENPCEQT